MTPEDQYPSTSDCGRGDEDDDLVIVCLGNALQRYVANPSRDEYVDAGKKGEVCAIGAVWAVGDGDDIASVVYQATSYDGLEGADLAAEIEKYLREEAKEAAQAK